MSFKTLVQIGQLKVVLLVSMQLMPPWLSVCSIVQSYISPNSFVHLASSSSSSCRSCTSVKHVDGSKDSVNGSRHYRCQLIAPGAHQHSWPLPPPLPLLPLHDTIQHNPQSLWCQWCAWSVSLTLHHLHCQWQTISHQLMADGRMNEWMNELNVHYKGTKKKKGKNGKKRDWQCSFLLIGRSIWETTILWFGSIHLPHSTIVH